MFFFFSGFPPNLEYPSGLALVLATSVILDVEQVRLQEDRSMIAIRCHPKP